MKPILKWAGGKRQLLKDIKIYMPEREIGTYYEPFLGGAAVLLNFAPKHAKVNDLNTDLINVYEVVKSQPDELMALLDEHKHAHTKDYYYYIRALDRDENSFRMLTRVERAARFIYLNKTGYNGLYRVNSKGQVNVPLGSQKNPAIFEPDNLKEVSNYLNKNKIELCNEDFKVFLKDVKNGDFVYLDPPYDPVTETAAFTTYQKDGFTKKNQEELRDLCVELHKKGVKIMVSNSYTDFICNLYSDKSIFRIIEVYASRSINSKASGRGKIKEVIIINYDDIKGE